MISDLATPLPCYIKHYTAKSPIPLLYTIYMFYNPDHLAKGQVTAPS